MMVSLQLLLHCRHFRHPWRSDGGNAVFAGAKNGGPGCRIFASTSLPGLGDN